MAEIDAVWRELLDELSRSAPATRSALLPPRASAQSAELRLPQPLNEELRSWFGFHDGFDPWTAGQIFPFNTAVGLSMAVEDSLARREVWQANVRDEDREGLMRLPAGTIAHTWLDSYVELAHDGRGGGLFVDLRPGLLHGCVGWWDKSGADDSDIVATNVASLLSDVLHSLRTGDPVGDWELDLVNGVIEWTLM